MPSLHREGRSCLQRDVESLRTNLNRGELWEGSRVTESDGEWSKIVLSDLETANNHPETTKIAHYPNPMRRESLDKG